MCGHRAAWLPVALFPLLVSPEIDQRDRCVWKAKSAPASSVVFASPGWASSERLTWLARQPCPGPHCPQRLRTCCAYRCQRIHLTQERQGATGCAGDNMQAADASRQHSGVGGPAGQDRRLPHFRAPSCVWGDCQASPHLILTPPSLHLSLLPRALESRPWGPPDGAQEKAGQRLGQSLLGKNRQLYVLLNYKLLL